MFQKPDRSIGKDNFFLRRVLITEELGRLRGKDEIQQTYKRTI